MKQETKILLSLYTGAGLLVIVMGGFSLYKYRNEEVAKVAKQAEAQQMEKTRHENVEAAFKALLPTEHIAAAKKEIEAANTGMAHKHTGAVPEGTPGLESLRSQLAALDAKIIAAKKKTDREALAKSESDGIAERKKFARSLENSYLDHGFNMDVTTQGAKAEVLRMKYALTSKVLARQITTGEVLAKCRAMGFRKVVLTNGFESDLGETYFWDLNK